MQLRHALPLALLLLSCIPAPAADPTPAVSIVQLLANPEKYDGKRVKVFGFVTLGFEGNGVYLHREDAYHGLDINGLWLDDTDIAPKDKAGYLAYKAHLDEEYDLIDGTFNAKKHGHLGLFSGTIEHITRFDAWSNPGEPTPKPTQGRVPDKPLHRAPHDGLSRRERLAAARSSDRRG